MMLLALLWSLHDYLEEFNKTKGPLLKLPCDCCRGNAMCISFAFNGIGDIKWFKIDILVKCACKQCQKKNLGAHVQSFVYMLMEFLTNKKLNGGMFLTN